MHYQIEPYDLNAHLYKVTLELAPSAAPTELKMPVWIPGSYMIREFSRHLVSIEAKAQHRALELEQLSKNAWRIAASRHKREVTYLIYAFDQSVRTAWLDEDRGFFNCSSLCLYSDSTRDEPHSIALIKPRDRRCSKWQVATSLSRRKGTAKHAFGVYTASNYDELIDKPVTLGPLKRLAFKAHGIAHEIVLTGAGDFDEKRLIKDVQSICEAQIALFDPEHKKPPFERYIFMLHASGEGYGGLEHRDSTALIAKRSDLPAAQGAGHHEAASARHSGAEAENGMHSLTEGYVTLLGLFSHEYFHAWNVKYIKPQAFMRYALESENHTRLLWLFEGFTSYYDDLMLLRAGVINTERYLKLLSKTFTQVQGTPGRLVESLAGASHNAWTKYYRADENTPNSTISYYQKGALVALALDATLRADTSCTLDDLMRHLYRRAKAGHPGVDEDEFALLLHQATGLPVGKSRSFEKLHIYGTADANWAPILAQLGCELQTIAELPGGPASWGGRLDPRAEGVLVGPVLTHGALQKAGLAKGDLIVAIEQEQVNAARWEQARQMLARQQALDLHYFRDGRLKHTQLKLAATAVKEYRIQPAASKPENAWPKN